MHGARNVGGGENSIFYIIRSLDRRKYRPIVIYSKENRITKEIEKEGIETIRIPIDQTIISLYRDQVSFNPLRMIVYGKHLLNSTIIMRKIIKSRKIKILHPHDNLSKIICGLTAKSLGIKVVSHSRDLLNKNIIEQFLLYFQLVFMDIIIAVSKANRDIFKINNSVPEKVKIIYNGINSKQFIENNNKFKLDLDSKFNSSFNIGIIGVFDKVKGHKYLFEAIKILVQKGHTNIKCLVIGDGRIKSELSSWVNQNLLNDNIIFLGFRRDIASCLKMVKILVIPSIQESFPRVMLEAMIMGIPVVGSEVGGIPEAVINGKTGYIVPSQDAMGISSAIERFIKDPELIVQMGNAGRKLCQTRFDLETNLIKTQAMYNKLMRI